MNRVGPLVFSMLLWLIVTGCATSPVGAMHKAGLKNIQLDELVLQDNEMRYGVDLSGTGNLTQVIAAQIVDAAGRSGIERMSDLMRANEIDVAALVHARARHHLQILNGLQLVTENGDGVIRLIIKQHGFDSPGLRFSKHGPVLLLDAELFDRSGKRIWKGHTGPLDLTSKSIGASWDEYEADPDRLRDDWHKQIDHVLARLFPTD